MQQQVTLTAEPGRPTGTRASRRLRRQGRIPAVVYGRGVEPIHVSVDGRELRAALTTPAGVNAVITLEVGGTRHLAMARQLQRHPIRGTVSHVDFVVVRPDEVVSAEVPIHLSGEPTEVLRYGGVLTHELNTLAVRARPGEVPATVEVDVSRMRVGETITVGDLSLPPGVTAEADPATPVVHATVTRAAAHAAAGAEVPGPAVAEGGEPAAEAAEAAEATDTGPAAEGEHGGEG
jgi:large subunit ribosomal protein L25